MIKVYGFPRSGNNLLAKYVANTFYPDRDTSVHNISWGHWSNKRHRESNPYGKCLGGHTSFPSNGIYIVRDTLDVAYSIWRSDGFTHRDYTGTFSEFLRTPLDWRYTPSIRYYGDKTVIDHHLYYLKESSLGHWVDYSSLVKFPEHVMELIAYWTGEEIKNFKRVNEPVGYSPNVGKKKDISKEDIDYVKSLTERRAHKLRASN